MADTGDSRRWALLSVVAAVALVLPLLTVKEVYNAYTLPRAALLLIAAPVVLWLLVDLALGRRFPRMGWALPALLGLEWLALAVASLLRAPDLKLAFLGSFERHMGLLSYGAMLVFALGAFAAVEGSDRRFTWLLRAIAASGLLAVPVGFQEHPAEKLRFTGAYGHANYSSNVLLIPLFVALGLALGAKDWRGRAGWAAAGALVAADLAILQTRGAWMGALAGGAVFFTLLFLGPLRLQGPARRRLWLSMGAAGAALALVLALALAVPAWRARTLTRLQSTLRLEAGTSGRYEGWRDSVPFFRDHGLLGAGVESFRNAFLEYKTESFGRAFGKGQLLDLHSMPLHFLAQGGVAALAAYLGLAALALARLWRAVRDPAAERGPRWAAAGLLSALTAHFAHNLTICHVQSASFFWHAALGAAAGAGLGWTRPKAGDPARARRPAPLAVRLLAGAGAGALSLVIAFHFGRLLQADAAILRCQRDSRQRVGRDVYIDIDAAIREGRRAVELAPQVGPYHALYSRTIGGFLVGRLQEATAPRRAELLQIAIAEAREALRLGGNKESYPLELGYLYYLAGDLEAAETQLRASIAADRHFWGSHRVLGVILLERGKKEEARKEYEAALRLAPDEPEVKDLARRLDSAR